MTMRVSRAEFVGLHPCPFCGGEGKLYDDYSSERDEHRWQVWHVCDNGPEGEGAGYGRACHTSIDTPWFKSREKAIEAWNTRIAVTDYEFSKAVHDGSLWRKMEPREPEWELIGNSQPKEYWDWECSCGECGHVFGVERRHSYPFDMAVGEVEVPNYCPDCGTPTRKVRK